jgi:hypothetical protein
MTYLMVKIETCTSESTLYYKSKFVKTRDWWTTKFQGKWISDK